MFDWSKVNYIKLWRLFNPRLRNKDGKKVGTKTIGYIDYFPDGFGKNPVLFDMLKSREISFSMIIHGATKHSCENVGIITLCYDKNYEYLVHDLILGLKNQIKALYGEDKAENFAMDRQIIYSDMFSDLSEKQLSKLEYE